MGARLHPPDEEDLVMKKINRLNTSELLKDLLGGWYNLHKTYQEQIKKFQFNDKTKKNLRFQAQQLYEKYSNQSFSQDSLERVDWDDGFAKQFFSVSLYGSKPYPLFSYPYQCLAADSLNPNIFIQILENWSTTYIDLESFVTLFWKEQRAAITRLSQTDLSVLKIFFKGFKTLSSIEFPTVEELGFKNTNREKRYSRLTRLGILLRHSIINYASLGLTPLLKIYNRGEEVLTDVENDFCVWKNALPSNKELHILYPPTFSTFEDHYSGQDVLLLKRRCDGTNIDLLHIGRKRKPEWKVDLLPKLDDKLNINTPVPQWRIEYETHDSDEAGNRFQFTSSDLRILDRLTNTRERQTRHFASYVGLKSEGHVYERLQHLRRLNMFYTKFLLYHVGLNARLYLFYKGTKDDLDILFKFVCHLPQYTAFYGYDSLFVMIWFPYDNKQLFLDSCTLLKTKLKHQKLFYYGMIDQNAGGRHLNLPALWNAEKKRWKFQTE